MTEKPNVVEDCMSGYCRECGRDLSDIAGELDYVSQVVDLPTLAPVVREYRHYKKLSLIHIYSTTIICIPRQIPKVGISWVRL